MIGSVSDLGFTVANRWFPDLLSETIVTASVCQVPLEVVFSGQKLPPGNTLQSGLP